MGFLATIISCLGEIRMYFRLDGAVDLGIRFLLVEAADLVRVLALDEPGDHREAITALVRKYVTVRKDAEQYNGGPIDTSGFEYSQFNRDVEFYVSGDALRDD